MRTFRVNLTATISGHVELEAESEQDALDDALDMDYTEWDEASMFSLKDESVEDLTDEEEEDE